MNTRTDAGLPIIRNWRALKAGAPQIAAHEYPVYTDSRVTGEVARPDWPYKFLNTVPSADAPGLVQAAIILRVDFHIAEERPNFAKTNTTAYHGGLITDEIAALVSLCTGSRMKAGGISRRFEGAYGDPLGRPVAWDRRPIPVLGGSTSRLVLPDVAGEASLADLSRLDSLLRMSSAQTVALVRSARLYQDAIWLAESEPALAWLLFVSALETAANQWRKEQGRPSERLRYARPELFELLMAAGGSSLVDQTAGHIEQSLGATKKFIDFSTAHFPAPPERRPSKAFQVAWEVESMKKTLSLIYTYRSNALHGGTPFPAPMCDHAFRLDVTEGYSEAGTVGLAASSTGGVWLKKDLPINLHAFHHFVRGTLLQWWATMTNG